MEETMQDVEIIQPDTLVVFEIPAAVLAELSASEQAVFRTDDGTRYLLTREGTNAVSYTFDRATPEQITGRRVGDMNDHIVVAVAPDESNPKRGYLLAVRDDGRQYVVWSYTWNLAENGIEVWSGSYDLVTGADPGSAFAAYQRAHDRLVRLTLKRNEA
jgi:hypothetical protein